MRISRLLSESTRALEEAGIENAAYEAGLIISWTLKKPLTHVYAHTDEEVHRPDRDLVCGFVKRRAKGEPFQYITGECEFMSLRFSVNPHVLIPRSDTEILAEAALFALGCDMPYVRPSMFRLDPGNCGEKRVLDVGTGSGCLAVSIAYYAKNARVDALDISDYAIETARGNAARNGVEGRIRFIRADFLHDTGFFREPYDLIISNPPYIAEHEKPDIMPSVRDYEPHEALFAGNGGMEFYERIAALSGELLAKDGIIAVECGLGQAERVGAIFSARGMETCVLNDISGIPRVVAARGNE
jgi:release factor glutamine methyltransferase